MDNNGSSSEAGSSSPIGSASGNGRRGLRIAQIAPLYERVPPKLYGGSERVVSYITEELVRRGHDVTLFASGDSQTRARLAPAGLIKQVRIAEDADPTGNLHPRNKIHDDATVAAVTF